MDLPCVHRVGRNAAGGRSHRSGPHVYRDDPGHHGEWSEAGADRTATRDAGD